MYHAFLWLLASCGHQPPSCSEAPRVVKRRVQRSCASHQSNDASMHPLRFSPALLYTRRASLRRFLVSLICSAALKTMTETRAHFPIQRVGSSLIQSPTTQTLLPLRQSHSRLVLSNTERYTTVILLQYRDILLYDRVTLVSC